MKKKLVEVTYSGAPVVLGRFGAVEPGDVLQLTEKEAESVREDDDFTFATVADAEPVVETPESEPDSTETSAAPRKKARKSASK